MKGIASKMVNKRDEKISKGSEYSLRLPVCSSREASVVWYGIGKCGYIGGQ